ncbi:ATP-binding cassette domain-containing protein [Chthonobacter albigriseus]|uniref:ATP-binding cassette domain-containing protein n=1 Tax=Chthonobacter albigriseus TaxID=1683161 RepID=UPI0015EFC0D0|nr:ATP-binding cassette domain-containing protein [Chthonobacter albigriseus]
MLEALTATSLAPLQRDRTGAAARTVAEPSVATGGTAVSITGLTKRYGDKTVLSGIDLSFRAGEFVAIVGRSGCGKSTLLRLLLGLEKPEGGEIRIGGQPAPRAGGDVARFIFQEPRLLPWQRVLDNVALGASRTVPADRRRPLAQEALKEVGLADRGGEWPSVLSGGQRQRVALARALVSHPKLLALDEPLGALDALTRIEMQGFLERVWKHQGFTAVLVTHDVSEAVALADRIVLIDGGRVALDVAVPLARPRVRGSAEFGAIEGQVLDRLFAGR